jgi:4-amino-4-deoxy-L-arabinose transferase-like glycosyltransferase
MAAWRAQPLLGTIVVLGILAGAFLRVWALGRSTINSDNAVVGLMAREALHGHFSAFYWGQPYGGAEAYAVAIVFRLFGVSSFTLGLTPAILVAISSIVLWRVGNRLVGAPIGAIAAVLFWVWPEVYVTSSIVDDGFRWLVLLCGLCSFLFLLRMRDGSVGVREWIGLGLAAGVGWWASPEMAYFLVPGGVYLVVLLARRMVELRPVGLLAGVVAAGVGSLPWWWSNLPHNFASLHAPTQPPPPAGEGPYLYHLSLLVREVLPMAFGLRLPLTGAWLGPSYLAEGLTVLAFGLAVAGLLALAVANRAWLLVAYAAAFPFIYAQSPFAWYWQDARYGVFAAPALALIFASVVGFVLDLPAGMRADLMGSRPTARARAAARSSAGSRRGWLVPGLAAGMLVLPGLALTVAADRHVTPYKPARIAGVGRATWTTWTTNPNNLPVELGNALVRWGVKYAYAGYWLAYDVTFLMDKRVLVTPSGPAYVRYPPYFEEVSASPNPAWIFVSTSGQLEAGTEAQTIIIDPGCNAPGEPCLVVPELEKWCTAHHIGYVAHTVGPYIVVIPSRRVLPEPMFRHYGIG